MDQSAIVSKAWQYVWKHKILWLFALFAGSLIGGTTGTSSWSAPGYRTNRHDPFWNRTPGSQYWFDRIETWFDSIPPETWIWVSLAAFAIILTLCVLSLFISTAGRAGLIKGLLLAEDRRDDRRLTFKEVWQGMKPYYWRLLLLRLFLAVAGFLLGLAIFLTLLFLTVITLGTILCLLLPLILLIIPINWLIQSLIAHATIALVDEDLDIFKAINRGWEVVSKNIWAMLLNMLIVTLISIAAAIVSLIPLGLASLPWILTWARGGTLASAGWIIGGLLVGLAVIVVSFIAMWVNTLIHGIFVVMFRELKARQRINEPLSFVSESPTPPAPEALPPSDQPEEATPDPSST